MKSHIINLLTSDALWLVLPVVMGYLANSIVSRGLVSRLAPSNPIRRAIRLAHGFLDKIDPPGALLLIAYSSLLLPLTTGCVGTLDETRGSVRVARLAGVQVVPLNRATCACLSSKERIWTGIATGGAIIAGAAGVATFPVKSHLGEQILAGVTIGGGVAAGVGLVEQQSYSREWVSEGCGL